MTTRTVGELVVERPSRARVFERFGLDYCCGGKLPLDVACQKKNVNLPDIQKALDEEAASQAPETRDWSKASMQELTAHIEATHHAYLKRELPRLEYMTGRVAVRHGDQRPELKDLHQVFLRFKADLESHMAKEERILFPMCRELEFASSTPTFHCGSVKNPVTMMIREHDTAGEDLSEMRKLAKDYIPPADACNTYRAMLAGLADIERDMHLHVHTENNILFPKAIAREAALTPA
jgi:regulator of cell morphogenesis and NO signaling